MADSDLPSSSFTCSRLNASTFLIIENDSFHENPFIYAKLHPAAPVLILTDTGCDSPSKIEPNKQFTHLRDFLENCPVACNRDQPINSGPRRRKYIIISSHCHYDHTLGIPQFLSCEDDDTQIIASAAGRDFIESDLPTNGLFNYLSIPTPEYKVTHWAQSFERLSYPLRPTKSQSRLNRTDLNITMIQTPGHTPDSLSWYDHTEMHLFTGDSLYEDGFLGLTPIIWTIGGNIIDWYFSMNKLLQFVRTENSRATALAARMEASQTDIKESNDNDWALLSPQLNTDHSAGSNWSIVPRRVKLGAGHITHSSDAEELLNNSLTCLRLIMAGKVDVIWEREHLGELCRAWKCVGYHLCFAAPVRLMDEAAAFFGNDA